MKRIALATLVAGLVSALVPVVALAKGASEAEISGPGLDDSIVLAGEGQAGGDQLMQIAAHAGFFPAVFRQIPDPMLKQRPAGELGPRYTITYVMPGPNGQDRLRQDVYPYASPDPVTYVEPGQPFFETEKTLGGWFVASTALKEELVAAGLPRTAPVAGDGARLPWTLAGALLALAAVLAVAAVGALRIRRRPNAATAA